VLDLQELVARGWSDAAILAELELTTPAAAEILTYLRQRHHDAL
jgi:hypothetical protein